MDGFVTLNREQRGAVMEDLLLELPDVAHEAARDGSQEDRQQLIDLLALLDDLGWRAEKQPDSYQVTMVPDGRCRDRLLASFSHYTAPNHDGNTWSDPEASEQWRKRFVAGLGTILQVPIPELVPWN